MDFEDSFLPDFREINSQRKNSIKYRTEIRRKESNFDDNEQDFAEKNTRAEIVKNMRKRQNHQEKS